MTLSNEKICKFVLFGFEMAHFVKRPFSGERANWHENIEAISIV